MYINTMGYMEIKYSLKDVFKENSIIHHKNNIKLDNCVENLELSDRKEHPRKHYNTSGYYNVCIVKSKRYTQGFYYQYQYYEYGDKHRKYIRSVNINKLENIVKSKGLDWFKLYNNGG